MDGLLTHFHWNRNAKCSSFKFLRAHCSRLPVPQQSLISLFPEESQKRASPRHFCLVTFIARYRPEWDSPPAEPAPTPVCPWEAAVQPARRWWRATSSRRVPSTSQRHRGHRPLPGRDSTLRFSEPVSQESAPFLGQIKNIQSRLNCLDFWICFWFFPHFLLQSN